MHSFQIVTTWIIVFNFIIMLSCVLYHVNWIIKAYHFMYLRIAEKSTITFSHYSLSKKNGRDSDKTVWSCKTKFSPLAGIWAEFLLEFVNNWYKFNCFKVVATLNRYHKSYIVILKSQSHSWKCGKSRVTKVTFFKIIRVLSNFGAFC